MMNDLSGRTALVTGASRGIGAAAAEALAHAGADLVLTGRAERELEQVAEAVRAAGRSAHVAPADLSDRSDIHRLADELRPNGGSIDVLVNNAGVSFPEPALGASDENWERTLAVNATATFVLSKRIGAGMVERGWGRIINVTSQAAVVGLENHAAYCASKWAVEGLTRVLAIEWAARGVTVNCVAPTVVNTAMARMAFDTPEKRGGMLRRIPAGRFAEVDEVASAIVYLASEGAAMINGDTLRVDGGWTAQ